jgi:hypothetical protein
MACEWGCSPLEIDQTMTIREMWMFLKRIEERHQRRAQAAQRSHGEDEAMTTERFIEMLKSGRS